MRRKRYTHERKGIQEQNALVEEIDAYYDSLSHNTDIGDIPTTSIHNLVGTALVACSVSPLDLSSIQRLLPNNTQEKQKFAAITMRIFKPTCTVLLFSSGKMVLTGCRTFIECITAALHVMTILRQSYTGVQFLLVSVTIQNIVGNVITGRSIDLDFFYKSQSMWCTYQANMFPVSHSMSLLHLFLDSPLCNCPCIHRRAKGALH